MDWFLYGNGLRHERVKGISIPQEDLRNVWGTFFFYCFVSNILLKSLLNFVGLVLKKGSLILTPPVPTTLWTQPFSDSISIWLTIVLFYSKFYIFWVNLWSHGIIGVHRPLLKFYPPPPKFRYPLDIKAPGPPLIYLVGLLAILNPHINICIGPPNTCVTLKQFNLSPSNIFF